MSDDILDLSTPHLRLVSLNRSPDVEATSAPTLPDYFVAQGYLAVNGRLMVHRQPSALLGQPSSQTTLPETDNASQNPAYDADTSEPTRFEDHGALVDQADPHYAYLMADVDEPNPTHAV